MAAGPNRDLYVLISTPQTLRNGPASRTVLALLDSTGKPRTGWPIALDGWSCENPSGDPPWTPVVAVDGSVRLVCSADSTDQQIHSRAFAFNGSGRSLPGWPVDLPGEVWGSQARVIDDRLFVVAHAFDSPDPATGQFAGSWWLLIVGPDGTVSVGRRNETNDAQNTGSLQLGPDGTAYRISYVGSATEITAFDERGVHPGWPVRIEGYSVGPTFGPDGHIYATEVLSDPQTTRLLVFDRDGRPASGASNVLAIGAMSVWSGAGAGLPATVVASDGTAFVLSDTDGRAMILGLDPSGRVLAGWPFRAAVRLQRQGSCPAEVTGCGVWLSIPATDQGDLLYVSLAAPGSTIGGSLVAIGRDGSVRPGWPVTLDRPGAGFWSEVVAPDGTVYALAREPKHGGASSAIVLAITADGTVRYRATIVEP